MQVSILVLSSQDFKKTTKLTWIAESTKAPLLPTIAVQFDDVISKPVLTKNDDFKDYIEKDSKVRPEADGRINIIVESNTFCHNFFSKLFSYSTTQYSTLYAILYAQWFVSQTNSVGVELFTVLRQRVGTFIRYLFDKTFRFEFSEISSDEWNINFLNFPKGGEPCEV